MISTDQVDAAVSTREFILNEAARCVLQDRNNSYGPPHQDFDRTAELVSTYLRGKYGRIEGYDVQQLVLNAEDIAVIMILLKVSRLCWSPDKTDTWIDIAGYAACGYEAYVNTRH